MPSFYNISKYFSQEFFGISTPEFHEKIKEVIMKNNIKLGDIIYIDVASYRPDYCFALVKDNNTFEFGEHGWRLPFSNEKTATLLSKNDIKYNELYLKMKKNKDLNYLFFMGETNQMINELVDHKIWDYNFKYDIELSPSSDDEYDTDEECLGCATGAECDGAHRGDNGQYHPSCYVWKKNDLKYLNDY